MQWFKWTMAAITLLGIVAYFAITNLNNYQTNGIVNFPALDKPVEVIRDDKGMAYIHADNLIDVIKAQGYITAQDRLFQMQLTRTLVQGRLAEYFGEAAKESDIQQRTLGFYPYAEKHLTILDQESKTLLAAYAAGVNQYINEAQNEHPTELGLANLPPESWRIADSLAIMYYMGWGSAANLKGEIISQRLIEKIGYEKFISIYPIAIHPNDPLPFNLISSNRNTNQRLLENSQYNFAQDLLLNGFGNATNHLATGSNNWVVASEKSPGGKPIVVNDPHLSTKLLPTTLYPIGLFTPEIRAVGVNVPGIPSILIGRNQYVAAGITNQYGDAQDLYIETIDPNNSANYLEGQVSIPFETIEETIKIKNEKKPSGFEMETFTIRRTRRGPVISNVQKGLNTDNVISVRWSPPETMQSSTGLTMLLQSTSVEDVKQHLKNLTFAHLNYVFADTGGNIGWHTTGKLPIRAKGNGTVPLSVIDSLDNWTGWIPFTDMPQSYNPQTGWIATANNKTVTKDYPYYFSSWFAPTNRYQRVTELLESPTQNTVDDHWQFMRDNLNVTARDISPILISSLEKQEETQHLAEILSQWDFRETIDSVATSIYQETYRNLAKLVFMDELGEELGNFFIANNYFWQERFGLMLKQGHSPWFDDVSSTDKKETLNELIHIAGLKTIADLSQRVGKDPLSWQWGKIHQIEFINPIRRQGIGKEWLGGGKHPMAGSGDTVLRALFPLDSQDNKVQYSAALRMVVDLYDDDKVLAVSPGGVSGRTLTPHFNDQIDAYMNGDKMYWWFSDAKIRRHGTTTLMLTP